MVPKIPDISIELKSADSLKPDIREKWKLTEPGLVVKKITRDSPAEFTYLPASGGFLKYFGDVLNKTDMKPLIRRIKDDLKI